jgi:hypothetical protein
MQDHSEKGSVKLPRGIKTESFSTVPLFALCQVCFAGEEINRQSVNVGN